MKRTITGLVFIIGMLCTGVISGDETVLSSLSAVLASGLGANDLSDMAWDGNSLWVSGSGTLNRQVGNEGKREDWIPYRQTPGFGEGSIFAMESADSLFILSWGWYAMYNGQNVPYGGGFSISRDHGNSWRHVPVTELFPDRATYKTPNIYTATWDFSISEGTIWAATLAGFLLKSEDSGQTWTGILPNGQQLDLLNPNHHGQSLDAYGDTLWVGTFQGINLSTDRGETWKNFSWESGEPVDISHPQPGNFVYAIEHKTVGGKTHVFAGGSDYLGVGQYGIYHTDNNGETWTLKSTQYNAWNFAFGHDGASDPAVTDSTVFAASDSGLAVSHDLGNTWKIMDIREDALHHWNQGERIAAVAVVADTLWATGSKGIARTNDWGKTWKITNGLPRVLTLDEGKDTVGSAAMLDGSETYAYPNPFSPSRRDGDYSRTNIHYALSGDARVSVTLFGYNGRKLRELVSNTPRSGGRDYDEVWDGRDEHGDIVPNGVYFYMIKTDRGDTARGKIVALD